MDETTLERGSTSLNRQGLNQAGLSGEQLDEISRLLHRRQQDLKDVIVDSLHQLAEQIKPAASGQPPIDLNHPGDAVSEQGDPDFEKTLTLTRREECELLLVDEALDRLAGGRYGRCEACEEPIKWQRLLAIPYTKHCITCAEDEAGGLTTGPAGPVLEGLTMPPGNLQ